MDSKWQSIKNQLSEPYRITIKREETFEEVNSYSLNGANLMALLLTVLLTVALLTFIVVAISPLKALLPGYGTLNERSEIFTLNEKLKDLEKTVEAQEKYTQNIQRLLVGDVEAYDQVYNENTTAIPDSAIHTERIPEDEQLRKAVAEAKTRYQSNLSGASIPLDQMNLIPPVIGTISEPFDPTDRHFGVDIVAPNNTPIKAMLDGYVVDSGWSLETGNVVAVQHSGDLLTFYKHNSKLLKQTGDFVKAGEAIAIIGNTGRRTNSPHLHFEMWHKGQPVNPVGFLAF